jgi:S-adenosylmethionine/arginine decarboxylase-like enzyme
MKDRSADDGAAAQQVTFGWELIIDLYDCDPVSISSEEKIREFAGRLCKILDMKPYGDPMTPYFGENKAHTKGYSLVQFIETSSITGHFSEFTKAAYINIFSCKAFDPEKAEAFTKSFFKAKRISSRYIVRN